jgi:hypothetical protein
MIFSQAVHGLQTHLSRPPSRPRLVGFARSADARQDIDRAATYGFVVRICPYEDELATVAAQEEVAMIVWEVGTDANRRIPMIGRAVRARATPVSVVARLDLTRLHARHTLTLAAHIPHARPSLRGCDDLLTDIAALAKGDDDRGAYSAILEGLLPSVPTRDAEILGAAAIAGHRRMGVREFAQICGIPVRTLEWRCHARRLMTARDLLAWMVLLHSLWRLDALTWTLGRAARAAGFASQESWSNFIARHVGVRPASLLIDGGFPALLQRCATEVSRGRERS